MAHGYVVEAQQRGSEAWVQVGKRPTRRRANSLSRDLCEQKGRESRFRVRRTGVEGEASK